MISLVYALGALVDRVGSQTRERSKMVSVHVRSFADALTFSETFMIYGKRQIMVGNVPVCEACFRDYNGEAAKQPSNTPTNQTKESPSLVSRQLITKAIGVRPKTTIV